jgi:hypothetical protein
MTSYKEDSPLYTTYNQRYSDGKDAQGLYNKKACYIEDLVEASITRSTLKTFIWRNIVCMFGVLWALVVENGKQFNILAF